MREIRPSGSTSGRWKRGTVKSRRAPANERAGNSNGHLNHRATSRLYSEHTATFPFSLSSLTDTIVLIRISIKSGTPAGRN